MPDAERSSVRFRSRISLDTVVREWGADPLFGRIIRNGESIDATGPCQTIASYLGDKTAEIRMLDEDAAEIVFAPDDDSSRARSSGSSFKMHPSYALDWRLERIHETYEEWRFVGCELCYATTGELEPDHGIHNCTRWPSSDNARRILCWLDSLRIPRFFERRGWCSYCVHSWVCDEVRMERRIAETANPEFKAQLVEEYDSILDPDGYCKNRPLVRRMVAALCAYDDQILGKVLSKMAQDSDGVDLTSEKQARQWFEQRIRSSKDFWVPRLVHVLDQLILAFRFRHAERQDQKQPAATIDRNVFDRLDSALEVEDWKAALDWLVGRCTYCAGRGYRDELIRHTLRQCKRGGAPTVRGGLGDMFYEEGFVPSSGCDICFLPRELCGRWKNTDGKWVRDRWAGCTYDEHLLCDSIIGFAACGKERYEFDVSEGVEDYREQQGCDEKGVAAYVDDETTATWLSQPLTGAEVDGSEMIRQLMLWTMSLKSYSPKD